MRLHPTGWNVFFACLFSVGQLSFAQVATTPVPVPESEAWTHLLQHTDLVYPPIAQAARIQGDVVIAVVIDSTGKIASEDVVSGPPMLRQVAKDAVKGWEFTPIQINGQAAVVTTSLTIPFYLTHPTKPQQEAAQAWFPLSEQCRTALNSNTNPRTAVDFCKQALDICLKTANITPRDRRTRLISYKDYGHALLADQQLKPALVAENRAVDIAVANLRNTDEAYPMPFYWRAMAQIKLGKPDKASADLNIAEISLRAILAQPSASKDVYTQSLAGMLKQHADLLDQMGKSADAQKLRTEASSLNAPAHPAP